MIPVLGGRYRLGPEIGAGGMGAVHRAWDETFSREVAIKLVHSHADAVERERLRREAQYLARLDHPNLVAVLDAGEDRLRKGDTVWFAMELVSGPDLRAVIRERGPLDGAQVRRVLAGLIAALGALHEAGVVHRDLKPANVLLTAPVDAERWDVKLVDLGIAQHLRTDHLTSTGQIVGTAAYLSPEQVSGAPIGAPSDVYALGLVALEALTGRIAFPGGPAESAAARLVRAPDLPRTLDHRWRRVLAAMTALDPTARPALTILLDLVRALPDEAAVDPEVAAAMMPSTELIPVVGETAVLPAPRWAGADATAVLAAHPPRRRSQARRHLLAGASVLVALIAAAGGVAAVSGRGGPSAHAAPASSQPVVVATHHPVAPTRTPSPHPTRFAAAVVAAAPAVLPTVPSPVATHPGGRTAREEAARRFLERLAHRWHPHRPQH